MSVTFLIPGALRAYIGGRSRVDIRTTGSTLRDAFETLCMLYPGLRDRIATEQGQIRQHINVFVGNEDSRYTGGLATPISDGAQISIVPAISGG